MKNTTYENEGRETREKYSRKGGDIFFFSCLLFLSKIAAVEIISFGGDEKWRPSKHAANPTPDEGVIGTYINKLFPRTSIIRITYSGGLGIWENDQGRPVGDAIRGL